MIKQKLVQAKQRKTVTNNKYHIRQRNVQLTIIMLTVMEPPSKQIQISAIQILISDDKTK